jgi:hypothetical protein
LPNPVPAAALGTIAYGDPATVALGRAPALFNATLETRSEFKIPATENPVPPNVVPYVLLALFAVIVSGARLTVNVPGTYAML